MSLPTMVATSWGCRRAPRQPSQYRTAPIMHTGMYRTWEFSHCDGFDCPHCGAIYSVRYTQLPVRDSESAYCENCHRKMSQWHSTARPCYTLIARPEGQTARTVDHSLRRTSRGPFLGVG